MGISTERWYGLAPRWRCASWLACSLLMMLGWMLFYRQPAQQQRLSQEAQRQRDQDTHAALWASARAFYPPPPGEKTTLAQSFTPLAFNTNGLRLVRWQPAPAGGELVVDAAWDHIPTLFSALAQHDMTVAHFSVAPDQQTLQVVLQLEHRDAG